MRLRYPCALARRRGRVRGVTPWSYAWQHPATVRRSEQRDRSRARCRFPHAMRNSAPQWTCEKLPPPAKHPKNSGRELQRPMGFALRFSACGRALPHYATVSEVATVVFSSGEIHEEELSQCWRNTVLPIIDL